ncbi:hypothetical protein ACIGMX_35015 [Streptomyces aquilus]|uniref:hypothetical protein n=1 Tax=Streptomyces aquilus TaxID=2548456 RepID=UPI0037D0298F
MSESIIVRVTLGSYDVVHPAEKQTQVYAQIPDVGRASWLLDADSYAVLKDEPWPHVIDSAHEAYERRGVVSDSASAAARKAIVDWLLLSEDADYDARYDAVQAAWEADQARRHPVARKLLQDKERLTAELEQRTRDLADTAAERDSLRDQVAGLRAERHATNEALSDSLQELRAERLSYAERAARETHPGRRQAWQMLARAEETEQVYSALTTPLPVSAPQVSVSADESGTTVTITPSETGGGS